MKKEFYSLFVWVLCFLCFSSIIKAQVNIKPYTTNYLLFWAISLPVGDFKSTTSERAGFAKTGLCLHFEGNGSIYSNLIGYASISFDINKRVDQNSYLTMWNMIGAGTKTKIFNDVELYGLGQIGFLFSNIPNETNFAGASFAYGFGAGVNIDQLNIGLRYYTGRTEFNPKYASGERKINASLLQLMIGHRINSLFN